MPHIRRFPEIASDEREIGGVLVAVAGLGWDLAEVDAVDVFSGGKVSAQVAGDNASAVAYVYNGARRGYGSVDDAVAE